MTLLMMGIASALVIASKAVPSASSTNAAQQQVAVALDRMNADLLCATSITELTPTAITVTVADRGHGAAGPETIRWAWSGRAGDALTRQYNGGTAQTMAANVSAFAIAEATGAGVLTSQPRVLMLVDALLPSADDSARQAKLSGWTFPVTTLSASATTGQFDAAIANCDVVYVPEGISYLSLSTLFRNPAVGIVNENDVLYSQVGISAGMTINNNDKFSVTNNTHMITSGFAIGNYKVVTSAIDLHVTSGTLAPGLQTLGTQQGGGSTAPSLAIIEIGAKLSDGNLARGRRVALPWGGDLLNPMSPSQLTADAMTILKRSLVWAAAPPVYQSATVSLTAGTAPAARTRVEFVNTPRVPTP